MTDIASTPLRTMDIARLLRLRRSLGARRRLLDLPTLDHGQDELLALAEHPRAFLRVARHLLHGLPDVPRAEVVRAVHALDRREDLVGRHVRIRHGALL